MRSGVCALVFFITLASIVSSLPDDRIISYEIYDKNNNLAARGWADNPDGSGNWHTQIQRNISAGDMFKLLITVGNVATCGSTCEEQNADLQMCQTWDPTGLERDTSVCGTESAGYRTIWNFTNYNTSNVLNFSSPDTKIITQYLVTRQYMYPGEWSFRLVIGHGGISDEKFFKLGIASATYYQMNASVFNVTNYNDINYFSDPYQNWSLNLNLTVKNIGNIPGGNQVNYEMGCREYIPGYTPVPCNSTSDRTGTLTANIGSEAWKVCLLYNATNTTDFVCDLGLTNLAYNFVAFKNPHLGPLGKYISTEPPINFTARITRPSLSSLYAVPGIAFNLTYKLINQDSGTLTKGNENVWIKVKAIDSGFATLAIVGRFGLPEKNVETLKGWYCLNWFGGKVTCDEEVPFNITIITPPGSRPFLYYSDLYPTQTLVNVVAATGVTYSNWVPCQRWEIGPWNHPFRTDVSLCGWTDNVAFVRLIYIDNLDETHKYVFPGSVFTYNYTVNNPLPVPQSFALKEYPVGPFFAPQIGFAFTPNPIVLQKSQTTGPGSDNGTLTISVPLGTPLKTYIYYVNASAVETPGIWDRAKLFLHVIAHDVEVVAINKTPNRFIYNPKLIDIVSLSVVLKNNMPAEEKATLNLTINSSLIDAGYENCGAQLIDGQYVIKLAALETKTIDCGAYINISDYIFENIVVVADAGVVDQLDSFPNNNHKTEIITIISKEQPAVALPEANIWIFVAMMLGIIIIIKRRGK